MSKLILKDSPVGIDTVINNINNLVYTELDWLSTDEENPVTRARGGDHRVR